MGKTPGPTPRPTHLKMLSGERSDRINHDEPVPGLRPVEPPWELDDEVQEVWDEQAPDRIAKGVLTHWDVHAFALWCEAVVVARRKAKDAHREAEVGAASPMSDFKTAIGIVDDLGATFGWTPSDRSRLVLRDLDRANPAERLLTSDSSDDLLS